LLVKSLLITGFTMSNEEQGLSAEYTIKNSLGLHARPASLFVQLASSFENEVTVEKDGEKVNGKSLMGLLMLAAGQGSVLKITVEGKNPEHALYALEALIERKFDEE